MEAAGIGAAGTTVCELADCVLAGEGAGEEEEGDGEDGDLAVFFLLLVIEVLGS